MAWFAKVYHQECERVEQLDALGLLAVLRKEMRGVPGTVLVPYTKQRIALPKNALVLSIRQLAKRRHMHRRRLRALLSQLVDTGEIRIEALSPQLLIAHVSDPDTPGATVAPPPGATVAPPPGARVAPGSRAVLSSSARGPQSASCHARGVDRPPSEAIQIPPNPPKGGSGSSPEWLEEAIARTAREWFPGEQPSAEQLQQAKAYVLQRVCPRGCGPAHYGRDCEQARRSRGRGARRQQ